jgi:Skp family chaperone for outer membrane proteins
VLDADCGDACFSPQRAFAASPEGKDVETRLTALLAKRAKELDARNQRLKALQDGLQRNTRTKA